MVRTDLEIEWSFFPSNPDNLGQLLAAALSVGSFARLSEGRWNERVSNRPFVDNTGTGRQNADMYNPLHHAFAGLFIPLSLAVFVGAALAKDLNPENPFNAPAPLYWCPGKKPGQQLSTKQSADCHPVYDKETAEAFRERATKEGVDLPDRHPIKLVELQKAASTFSDRYHAFVSCCSTEPNARADILDLIDEANHLLEAAQQKGMPRVSLP